MKLIESKTLGTAQASIEFTSIPQTFTDLFVMVSGRSSGSGNTDDCGVTVNGTTSGYSGRALQGSGSAASSFTDIAGGARFAYLFSVSANSSTANTFGNGSIYIPNYTGSTNKSFSFDSVDEGNATAQRQTLAAGLLSNTAPITSIKIGPENGNFAIGSMISLYGITKGSDGIVTTS
jgi:hypothetical protein